MTYTLFTPIKGTGRLTAANMNDASGSKGKPLDGQTIKDLEATSGLNGDILFAQMCEETGYGTSDIWLTKNNPGGIGAVDGATNEALSFDSPRDGIIADFSHMLTYTDGDNNNMRLTDPRYKVVPAEHRGTVRVIGDLGSGVWATDTGYAAKIVNIANSLLARYNGGSGNGNGNGGNGVIPDKQYSLPVRLDLQNNSHSWIDRPTNPDGRILAIVKHVTAGESLDGALSWNRNPSVKASSHFYIDKDGEVVQDVSLYNGAWSNGNLAGDTLPPQFDIVKQNGWNPNDFTISIEHVGNPDDADFPTDAQLTADARLTADLCDKFQVPVDEDHILGHYRFDSVTRPNCPGPHWDFGRDVRAVSDLLNGVQTHEQSHAEQHAPNPADVGSGTADSVTGTSGEQTDKRNEPMAASSDGSGEQSDAASHPQYTFADGITATDEHDTGAERGITFHYGTAPAAGIRVSGRFYDAYTDANPEPDGWYGTDAGFERFGSARCSQFAATPAGYDHAVTLQIFDHAIMVLDGDTVSLMPVGVMAARYLLTHGTVLPSDMRWI